MNLLHFFGIGEKRVLAKNCQVPGTVTLARNSYLYVVKKPVRLYPNERNTIYSHVIHFTYIVDGHSYTGKRFISLQYRCPQKGETIDVYYDPANPQHYACYGFGPAVNPIGW